MFCSKKFTGAQKNKDFIDYAYGSNQESVVKSHIENYLGYGIKSTDRYDIFDFVSANSFIELKSRRIESTKYEEALIGLNKINWVREFLRTHADEEYRFYFFFNYLDQLRVIKYDGQKFKQYKIREMSRADRPQESSDVVLIPVCDTEIAVVHSNRLNHYI